MAESQDQPIAAYVAPPPSVSMIPWPTVQQPSASIPYEPLQAAQVKPIVRERRMSNPPAFPLHNYLKDKDTPFVPAAPLVVPQPIVKTTQPPSFPLHAYLKPDAYQPRPAIQPQTVNGDLDRLHPAMLPKKTEKVATTTNVNKVHPNHVPNSRYANNEHLLAENTATGTKNKIVVFGEWGPFTYGAPAKVLQLPENFQLKQQSSDSSQFSSLHPSMTKAKPFTAQQQPQQPLPLTKRQKQLANQRNKNTKQATQVYQVNGGNKKVVTQQPKSYSHLTQRLTPDDCREALSRWVSKQRCKNKKVPKECHITGIVSYQTIDYTLETFDETRSVACGYKPYRHGETINAVGIVAPTDPWTIVSKPKAMFQAETQRINLPNMDIIQPCYKCNGNQWLKCGDCQGAGSVQCNGCNGKKIIQNTDRFGRAAPTTCHVCVGQGYPPCKRCTSKGRVVCTACQGEEQLRWFLQVIITYINHVDKYVHYMTQLPKGIDIKTVKPEILFREQSYELKPIEKSDNQEIIDNSKKLVLKAAVSYPYEKRIIQQHYITAVSCFEIDAEFNNKPFKFWIYGQDRQVKCDKYPGGGSCCTIL